MIAILRRSLSGLALVWCAQGCCAGAPPISEPRSVAAPASSAPAAPEAEAVATTAPLLQVHSKPVGLGGAPRNLFVEAGLDAVIVQQRVAAAYQSLFHGNADNQTIFYSAGKNAQGEAAYISDIGNGDVRSEGMSYGMWIAVQMGNKADFDALWNWARSNMYHDEPKHPAYGYFSWQMRTDGTPIDEMPAADGEEYFAMSLLMAENRWGNAEGIFNYGHEGRRILKDMVHRPEIEGPCKACQKPVVRATSLFNSEQFQVRFTPDMNHFKTNADHTDPSYHLPAFYELFALWGPKADRAFWQKTAAVSRASFSKFANSETGLSPDYANFDGTPFAASWDAGTANFRFDAWRVAMNVAVDYAWWGKDKQQIEQLNRIQAFFEKEGLKMYGNQYALGGKKLSTDRSSGLIAMNGVASMAATGNRAGAFVKEVFSMPIPTGKWRYYDGALYMMSLLYLSGQAQIYWPQVEPVAEVD